MIQLLSFMIMMIIVSGMFSRYVKRRICFDSIVDEFGIVRIDMKSFIVIISILLIPILFVAFRDVNTGIDTKSYMYDFFWDDTYLKQSANSSYEFLYWGVCYFCKHYLNFRWGFFIFAFVGMVSLGIGLYKLSYIADPFVIMFVSLLLFYQEYFNGVRQMIAVGICLIAYSYSIQRQPVRFFIAIAIALGFHSSALLAIPIYFAYSKKILGHTSYIRRILLCIIGIMVAPNLIKTIISSVTSFSRFQNYSIGIDNMEGVIKSLILTSVIYIFVMVLQNSSYRVNDQNSWLILQFVWFLSFIYLSTICMQMYSNWFFRVGYYYQFGGITLMGMLTRNDVKSKSFHKIIILSYYICYYIILNYINNFDTSALINFQLM